MPAIDRASPLARNHIRRQVLDLETENIAEMAIRARGIPDVITLWYGEGDLVTPDFIRDAAKASIDAGHTFYVPDMRGEPSLTEALAAYQTRLHGRDIPLSRSTIAPSGMAAVLLAMELVVEPGSNVVYVEPQWPNIRAAIHLVGGEPRAVALDEADGAWRLDLDRLFAACDARTRAIVFSTPSNPLGWTASEAELQALIDFSRRTGIWIVSDEMYNRLSFTADRAPSVLQIAEDEDLVLAVNGFSKAWAMTGWRIGWLSHPPSVSRSLSAMTQYMNSGTAHIIQSAARAALIEGEPFVRSVQDRCRAGVEAACAALAGSNRLRLTPKPTAGMYVNFSVDGEPDARAACQQILEDARVGLAPGSLFGASARHLLRMCIFRDAQTVTEASRRIGETLRAA